ncbi:DinB family protein [Rapidithrix thailandica]|uniref:DinB family protein n=1 Tax=Rapidithrix thailandica TaxID=413964 RepID=A0AAW9SCU4_9BACT
MKAFFTELFQYNHHYDQELIVILTKNPEKASEKSIRLLSHIPNVHKIWLHKIQTNPLASDPWKERSIHELEELNKENYESTLQTLNTIDLEQLIQYSTFSGQAFNHSVRDILFQAINHSTYHRGQIATEIRLSGLEPPLTDYIYYKMTQK